MSEVFPWRRKIQNIVLTCTFYVISQDTVAFKYIVFYSQIKAKAPCILHKVIPYSAGILHARNYI